MKIVTNGKYYRIQLEDGTFVQDYHSYPDTPGGYYDTFQTRFYNKAKRRYLCMFKGKVEQEQQQKLQWIEVPCL